MSSIWKNFGDIVILPPQEVTDYAISLSEQLGKKGTPWQLDAQHRRPHLSLHHFPINPEVDVEKVAQAITKLGLPGGDIRLSGITSPRDGAIFLDVDQDPWLLGAAHIIGEHLWENQLAIEDKRFLERWHKLDISPRMEENIQRYGSPMMGKDLLPHFTLGIFADEEAAKARASELDFKSQAWHVETLQIVQVGEGFTAGDTLATIKLT